MKKKEALFYRILENKAVKCCLCPQDCYIINKNVGKCGVRRNEDGKLYSINYGKIAAYHVDPIEKKPLYHFYPGSRIFSVGSFGCNLDCGFCQNFNIARSSPQGIDTTGENLVNIAQSEKNNIGIAYTYNEPTIWYEFVYETAKRLHEIGLKNVLVTNGFIKEEPLKKLLPFVDAMNIDLKSSNNKFYEEICKGKLNPVKETIATSAKHTHVEITTLVVNNMNDTPQEIENIAHWIAEINPDIPLHLSRYFPTYKMDLPPTPIEKLLKLSETAKRYLNYVYIGNVENIDKSTYCPGCGQILIDRNGKVNIKNMHEGKCMDCGREIAIIY